MLNIGFTEILLFGIIALVVLGPDKLPIAVRTAGRWYARLRYMVSNLQQDIEKELQLSELREHMQQELSRIKSIEAQMQAQLDQMHDELAELNHNQTASPAKVLVYLPIALALSPAAGAPYTLSYRLRLALAQPNLSALNPLAPNSSAVNSSVLNQKSADSESVTPESVMLKKVAGEPTVETTS